MTSPGRQLTTGDEFNPPTFGSPAGAYVSDGVGTSAITDLNGLDESKAKARMRSPLEGTFAGMRGGFWGALSGIVQGVVGFVTDVVDGVVTVVTSIVNGIGSLLTLGSNDVRLADSARVAGELAIAANMSSSLEYLDEIQRVGGAFMGDWTPEGSRSWHIDYGEQNPHPLPLGTPFELRQGVGWLPPYSPWTPSTDNAKLVGNESSRGFLAKASGTLTLEESGLWMIYFQAALLQGTGFPDRPADVWCYVTASPTRNPVGAPDGSSLDSYHKQSGFKSAYPVSDILAYGRAGSFIGTRDSTQGGGNTVSGYMMAYLPSANWHIHLSASGYRHYAGPASTFVFATKVNSDTLRQDLNQAKADIQAALPGVPIEQSLTEAAIVSMVSQAGNFDTSAVPPPIVEVP